MYINDHAQYLKWASPLIGYDHTPDTPSRKPVVIKTVETRDGEVNIPNISWSQENVFHTFYLHLDIQYTV
jgi:hypothetical protein